MENLKPYKNKTEKEFDSLIKFNLTKSFSIDSLIKNIKNLLKKVSSKK
jgi:hypothetical protein